MSARKGWAFVPPDGHWANHTQPSCVEINDWLSKLVNGYRLHQLGLKSCLKAMKCTLASARTFPPAASEGWIIHFIERQSRYWVADQAGKKQTQLFEQSSQSAWEWAKPAHSVCWVTDGERRSSKALWKPASVYSKQDKLTWLTIIARFGGKG